MRSLAGRVLLVEVLGFLMLAAIMLALAAALLNGAIDAQQRQVLDRQLRGIEAGLRAAGGTLAVTLPPDLAAVYASGFDGRAFEVLDSAGDVIASSRNGIAFPPLPRPLPRTGALLHVGHYVALGRGIAVAGRPAWLVVSQDETDAGAIIDDIAHAFLVRYVASFMLVLVIVTAVSALVLRQLDRRVREVALRAEQIGPGHPGLRLDESRLPAEVESLVRATNRLVDRLDRALAEQRAFVGNVAHELKTPLAVLKMQADDFCAHDRQAMDRSLDRMAHVISQLRSLADLETLDHAGRMRFDLRQLARDVAETTAPQVYAADHTLELRVPSLAVEVEGAPTLVGLAIRNLIDNAWQHTPPGTAIVVEVGEEGRVAVSDNGPGIAVSERQLARRRFWRANQARADNAGLGLSIVDRICEVHGTTLEIGPAPGNGASLGFVLPAATGHTPDAESEG